MQRDKPRPDWGWETPWDLYVELARELGFGDLWMSANSHGWTYQWTTHVRGRTCGYQLVIGAEELMRWPVREIAQRHAAICRAQLREMKAAT